MFDNLSDKLQRVFKNLRGEGRLTAENMESALREVRVALLEADVNFKVVKQLIEAPETALKTSATPITLCTAATMSICRRRTPATCRATVNKDSGGGSRIGARRKQMRLQVSFLQGRRPRGRAQASRPAMFARGGPRRGNTVVNVMRHGITPVRPGE